MSTHYVCCRFDTSNPVQLDVCKMSSDKGCWDDASVTRRDLVPCGDRVAAHETRWWGGGWTPKNVLSESGHVYVSCAYIYIHTMHTCTHATRVMHAHEARARTNAHVSTIMSTRTHTLTHTHVYIHTHTHAAMYRNISIMHSVRTEHISYACTDPFSEL